MPIIIFLVASDDSELDTTPVVVPGCPNFLILKNEFAATVVLVTGWPKFICDEDNPTMSFITNCFVITNIAELEAKEYPLIPAEDSGPIAVPFMLIVNKLNIASFAAIVLVAIENDIS